MTVANASPPVLRRTDALLARPLAEAVGSLPEVVQPVVAYHLGWATPNRPGGTGGKALRAALAVLSTEAARAPFETGVPGAVAVELVHNFSLLHDDVMDGDTTRRHRPAAWTIHGQGLALLAGTSLLVRAQAHLAASGPTGPVAGARLEQAIQQLVVGQALDLAFEQRDDVTVADWTAMAQGKTAALLATSTSVGAVLADAPESLIAALATYGQHLGLAYQAVDDLLGIWGSTAVTGKPVGADLRRGKKTLPVVAALEAGGPRAKRLADLLAQATGDDADVTEMAWLIDANGGRSTAEAEATRQIDCALAAIHGVDIPRPVVTELASVARFVTARDR